MPTIRILFLFFKKILSHSAVLRFAGVNYEILLLHGTPPARVSV